MMDDRLLQYLHTIGASPDALDGWTIKTAQRDGVDCGVVLTKGPEVHMLAFGAGAMSRKNILEHLSPILDRYGYVTTRVPIAERDHRLREILGFEMTWEDDKFTYWALTSLPFRKRSKSCQL